MSVDPVSARRDYGPEGMEPTDLDADPVVQLQRWMAEASAVDQGVEPSAMVLSTVDPSGRPSSRTVLLREVRDGQLWFFTSYGSRKGRDLAGNPHVSLLFRWGWPLRQVEVQGTAALADPADSDAYFATRPRGSQLSAHASPQSAPIRDRAALDAAVAAAEARFAGREVPRPHDWGGYVVTPQEVEFWQGRTSRLHDRLRYSRVDGGWVVQRLAP